MVTVVNEESILSIKERIEVAAKQSGRSGAEVQLMAVSKTRSIEEIEVAARLGMRLFGENRVQEAAEKFEGKTIGELHLIGHLQTNKVKKAVALFDLIQSVDSFRLAKKISDSAVAMGKRQSVFLEQNCSGEVSKSGFDSLESILQELDALRQLEGIQICGLMTMAPLSTDERVVRRAFTTLRNSFQRLKEQEGLRELQQLSMGMSGDFEIAIEEGSSLVRIGTALFGARDYGVQL